jgi:predicted ribosome quality control (RQC) complex YloA/Tae2 family protein
MDLTTLHAVLSELRQVLLPSRFEKAQQPTPHTLQLGLRGLQGRHWLEISWLALAPRLLAIDPPPRRGEGSTLALQLQHGLAGLALVALDQQGWERVVELRFAPRPGEPVRRTVVVELMGRHSNVFLLDEEGRVIAPARQVRKHQSRLRPIGTGDVYTPPPPARGDPPCTSESQEHWRRRLSLVPVSLRQALQQTYQGISPALALQLAGDRPDRSSRVLEQPVQALSEAGWEELWRNWRRWLSDLELHHFGFAAGGATAYRCWGLDPAHNGDATWINHNLARYYSHWLARQELRQRCQQLEHRLLAERDRQERQRAEQEALLDQVENAEALQRQADALLCLPSPDREQVAEAQVLYRRARRLRRSVAAIKPRLAMHEGRIEQIETSLGFLEQHHAGSVADTDPALALEELEVFEQDTEELLRHCRGDRRAGPGRAAGTKPSPSHPTPMEVRTPGGLRAQVGRNHRQNEWISLRQARRGDLWFHAQECPGSHVMLKSSEAPASEADLQAAADLAAHFSRARGNARVAVLMVPSEQLQRIGGAGPGTVSHRGGKVVWASPARAVALLDVSSTLPSVGAEPSP